MREDPANLKISPYIQERISQGIKMREVFPGQIDGIDGDFFHWALISPELQKHIHFIFIAAPLQPKGEQE